jgi:hypothetical protein
VIVGGNGIVRAEGICPLPLPNPKSKDFCWLDFSSVPALFSCACGLGALYEGLRGVAGLFVRADGHAWLIPLRATGYP